MNHNEELELVNGKGCDIVDSAMGSGQED